MHLQRLRPNLSLQRRDKQSMVKKGQNRYNGNGTNASSFCQFILLCPLFIVKSARDTPGLQPNIENLGLWSTTPSMRLELKEKKVGDGAS